jgi:transposase
MTSASKDAGAVPAGLTRRAKKLLAPSVKFEIFLQLVRGETTINAAADTAGVDRSTIMKLRQVAKEGAPGRVVGVETGGREVGPGC